MEELEDEKQNLIAAVNNADIREIKHLLNSLDSSSLTFWEPGFYLLCESLKKKQLQIAKLLVKSGFMVKRRCRETTALHVAALYGDLEVIHLILDRSYNRITICSMEDINEDGLSVFHVYAQRRPFNPECQDILEHFLQTTYSSTCKTIEHPLSKFQPMHFAAECGNVPMISLLHFYKADVNHTASKNWTPLHVAVLNGQIEAVKELLQLGANHTIVDENAKTALCLAVEKQESLIITVFLEHFSNRVAPFKYDPMLIYSALETNNESKFLILENLLSKGGNPNICSSTGKTPLFLVVENKNEEAAALLLKYGANPNKLQMFPMREYSPLHLTVEIEHEPLFKLLLRYSFKPPVDTTGQTPLHIATKNGSLKMAAALLDNDYSLKSLFTLDTLTGSNPLHIAVENGFEDFVTLFLKAGISIDVLTRTGLSSLHIAAKKRNTTMIKFLLNLGADPNIARLNNNIETPLFFAAEAGSSNIVEILSELSKYRNQEWLEGYASLFVAAYQGHEVVVQSFLDKGVNPNSIFGKYLTPLQAAAQNGHEKIINLLLEYGAEINPRGEDRYFTPLMGACFSGSEKIVQILLEGGADVNQRVSFHPEKTTSSIESLLTYGHYSYTEFLSEKFTLGFKSIHFAAASGKKSIIEMLLRRGADLKEKAVDETTPLCVAIRKQQEEVVAYLLKSGAYLPTDKSVESGHVAAILLKNVTIVEHFVKFRSSFDDSVLRLAVEKSSANVVEAHLKGSFVNMKNMRDPLFDLALKRGDKDILSKLLDYGVDINSENFRRERPLFQALKANNKDVFKFLIKKGASLENYCQGYSLLYFLMKFRPSVELIKLVVEFGVDINRDAFCKCDFLWEQILFDKRYAISDRLEILRIFLKYGFHVNSTSVRLNNMTILYSLCKTSNHEMVKLMLQHGSDLNIVFVPSGYTPFSLVLKNIKNIHFLYNDPDEMLLLDWFIELQNEFKSMVIIIKSMILELVKLEVTDKYIHPENRSLLNKRYIKRYYNFCHEEIRAMKKKNISKKITYFDFLMSSERKLADYAGHLEVIEARQSKNYELEFPLYKDDLEFKFNTGVDMRKLLYLSATFLDTLFRKEIPTLVIDHLFQYLSFVDLRSLCRACNPFIFVSLNN